MMIKLGKTKCNTAQHSKCLSCERRSVRSHLQDFKLCDDDLDLIVGGMLPEDLKEVMAQAALDMNLQNLTPTSYFQD